MYMEECVTDLVATFADQLSNKILVRLPLAAVGSKRMLG